MSLLTLENIEKEYRNQTVLDGVSLRVERGERLALVGPNGAGKTTLLKIAMGLEEADRGNVILARNIKVGHISQDLHEVKAGEGSEQTALHYEKIYRMERTLRDLEKQISQGTGTLEPAALKNLMDQYTKLTAKFEAVDGYTIETKIKKILLGLGLRQESLDTPVARLSGGEKMRVSVARVLLEEPDLLILDEPTNHLDIHATEWFESFLKKFRGGILFVSHDRYFLDRVATRVAELDQGTVCVRSGNYSKFVEHKQQMAEFMLSEQKRLRLNIRNTNEIVQGLKHHRNISAIKSRQKEMDRLARELKGSSAVKSQQHLYRTGGPKIRFKKGSHISKDIAWAENLHKSFGDLTLFDGAGFHIYGGERVGIIGPNGCGKTTLVNMLLGKDQDFQGELKLGDWVNYSYMGQEVLFHNDSLTVAQLIMSKKNLQEGEAREYLARFQFYGDEINKTIKVLSGGERVRLYLACVMLEDADCLILDEPTNHLDMAARDAFEKALGEFGGTIIAVTHDRYFLTNCVNKILEVDDRKINTWSGNYETYRELKFGSEEEAEEKENKSSKSEEYAAQKAKRAEENRARARKQQAERERKELEARIMSLEETIAGMEASFDEATPRETYEEYGKLKEEIDGLYERWEALLT